MIPVLTARMGKNGPLFKDIIEMYIEEGATIADVTYGHGNFWTEIDKDKYTLLATDITEGVDMRRLPYESRSLDAVVIDPPYTHSSSAPVKESICRTYNNQLLDETGHEAVMRLYAGGIIEAARVLKKNGTIIVKTQDEIESGKQRLTHVEIIDLLEILGFAIEDIFVLVQETTPAMREQYQKHARKNHSYFVVGRLRR